MTTSDGSVHAGTEIRCRGCGGRFHRLTDKFRPVPPMRGSYLKLLPKWREGGWYAFPEHEWVVGDNVQCPQCGTPYTVASIMKQFGVADERVEPAPEQAVEPEEAAGVEVAGQEEDENHDFEQAGLCGDDDTGIYADLDGRGDVVATVMSMTRKGESQSRIAETCQISIYAVRKIQNGKKV